MAMRTLKNVPGHKKAHVLRGVLIVCECGWESSVRYGPSAGYDANSEYLFHRDQHADVAQQPADQRNS